MANNSTRQSEKSKTVRFSPNLMDIANMLHKMMQVEAVNRTTQNISTSKRVPDNSVMIINKLALTIIQTIAKIYLNTAGVIIVD